MSLRQDNVDRLLEQLASNQMAYQQLVEAAQFVLQHEEVVLHQIAEQSLLDLTKRDGAIMQLGRVEMIRSLLQYATRHTKKINMEQ